MDMESLLNHLGRFMKMICMWKYLVTYSLQIMIISTSCWIFPFYSMTFEFSRFSPFSRKTWKPIHFETAFQNNAIVLGVSIHLHWVHAMRDMWAVISLDNGKLFYGGEHYLMISLAFCTLMIAMQESKLQHLQNLKMYFLLFQHQACSLLFVMLC